MKTFKELRKAKGLTMGKLAELSGVSAKTVSQYEQNPPGRPSRKVIGKISEALDMSMDELMAYVYPSRKRTDTDAKPGYDGTIMLEEAHVSRLIRLIDKELEELRYILMDGAELAEDYPALARCMDMINDDIDMLMEIKGCFLA
ncbi:MAG TPA: helix-turn-helix transcriptional regulator [Deltaproteobacteria bacterium]|nr:helix-turn-helix transcriptional regulator [Deltaproteobacteria bacterium]HPR55691.1 helix-turn-helix transcriptional regulator [Deltaproteobacteria bacterium]